MLKASIIAFIAAAIVFSYLVMPLDVLWARIAQRLGMY
jgi:hypothetical protein